MADKMMRVAGRGEDGTAKALRTTNDGRPFIYNPKINLLEKQTSSRFTTPIYFADNYLGQSSNSIYPIDISAYDSWFLMIENNTDAQIRLDGVEYSFERTRKDLARIENVDYRSYVPAGQTKKVRSSELGGVVSFPYAFFRFSTSGSTEGDYKVWLYGHDSESQQELVNELNNISENTDGIQSLANQRYFQLSSGFHDDGNPNFVEEMRPCIIQSFNIIGEGHSDISLRINSADMDQADYFKSAKKSTGFDRRLNFLDLQNFGGENSLFKISKFDEESSVYAMFLKREIYAPLGFRITIPGDGSRSYLADLSVLYF